MAALQYGRSGFTIAKLRAALPQAKILMKIKSLSKASGIQWKTYEVRTLARAGKILPYLGELCFTLLLASCTAASSVDPRFLSSLLPTPSPSSSPSPSPSPSPTVSAAPDPTGLNLSAVSSGQIQLSWSSGGGTTSGYQISYQSGATAPADCNSGTIVSAATINAATAYLVTGLAASREYSFRVCAINSASALSSGITGSATTWQAAPGRSDD